MRRFSLALVMAVMPSALLAQPAVEGSLTLGGKIVPLPPGPWRMLHQAADPGRSTEGSLPTTTHRAVLVQERAGRAAAVIVANAATEVGGVWSPHGICVNATAIQRTITHALRGALDCRGLVVIGSGRGPNTPAYLNALYDEGARRPGWIPPRWLSVQIVQSQQMHWLSVEYRYAPSVFAPATGSAANWNDGARSAAQQEVVQRLATFASEARAGLLRGLYGRPPQAPLAAPF